MSSHASATLPLSAKLSKYAEKLPEAAKSRYLAKIELVGGVARSSTAGKTIVE
jgi:hypothetical protein